MNSLRYFAVLLLVTTVSVPAVAAPASPEHGDAGHGDSHAAAGHGDAGHATDPFATDPIAIDPDLSIFTILVFAVLFAVMWKFAWAPIAHGLELRDKMIGEGLEAAGRSQEEARLLMAQYEQKLAAAAEQVRTTLEQARRDAEHTRQEIVAEAKAAAAAERDRGIEQIAAAKEAALRDLSQTSAIAAVALARKFVPSSPSDADRARLVQEAMSEVRQVLKGNGSDAL